MTFKITGPGFYRQRDGGKAYVCGKDRDGLWVCEDGDWALNRRRDDGTMGGGHTQRDLIAPWTELERGTMWVVVWSHGVTPRSDTFETEHEARDFGSRCNIKILAIFSCTWTEGDGL